MPENNTWVKANRSRTAILFIHGIWSSSNSCWRNKKAGTYWPTLVEKDPNFEEPSVFVSGYTADPRAGLYDTYDAAEEVMVQLRSAAHKPAPLSKDRLLFVCHSQGGIVVRQMLVSYFEEFAQKKVGVVLCGSPSWGSFWGTVLTPLSLALRFRQATGLRWGGESLVRLDREFLKLIQNKRIPELSGMSLVETRGPLGLPKIVPEASATRYFPIWHRIPKSTHGAIVKPSSASHLSHVYLRDFAQSAGLLTREPFRKASTELLRRMDAVLEAHHVSQPLGPDARAEAISALREQAEETISLTDREDRLVGVGLDRISAASLDAGGKWAFINLDRAEFVQIRNRLAEILKTL